MNGQAMVNFVSTGLFGDPTFAGDIKKEQIFGVLHHGKRRVTFAQKSQVITAKTIAKYAQLDGQQNDSSAAKSSLGAGEDGAPGESEQQARLGDHQFIECRVSKVALDLTKGTQRSIEFLQELAHATDDMLYGELQLIIDYKWERDSWWVRLQAAASLIYLANVAAHVIWFQQSKPFCGWLLFLSLIFFGRVMSQLWTAVSIKMHFESMWNCLDSVGAVCILAHCALFLCDEDFENYRKYDFLLLTAAFCLLLRGVSRLSPFLTSVRLLLGVMIQTFRDIGAFLFLFAYMIAAMSLLHLIVSRGDPHYWERVDDIGFSHSLRQTYQQIYGENPDVNIDLMMFGVYMSSTLFLNIVTLNLLISIISDTYDKVTMT